MHESLDIFEGLSQPGQRRLWLLHNLLQKLEPEEALRLAERMEKFVLAGDAVSFSPSRQATEEEGGRVAGSMPPFAGKPHAASPARPRPSGSRLLEGASLQEFTEALMAGADNSELARRFSLTPRQANGLRMGIEKRYPQLRAVKRAQPKRPELDRTTELQMQEAFLRQKPAVTATLEDVIRFLRQRGDVIVRAGDSYIVNDRATMTAEELVARANQKRAQLQRPPFPSTTWSVSPVLDNAAGCADAAIVASRNTPSEQPRA
jgi:hypothetical protein